MNKIKWNKEIKSFSVKEKQFSDTRYVVFCAVENKKGQVNTKVKTDVNANSLQDAVNKVKANLNQDIEDAKRSKSPNQGNLPVKIINVTGWGEWKPGSPAIKENAWDKDFESYDNKYFK